MLHWNCLILGNIRESIFYIIYNNINIKINEEPDKKYNLKDHTEFLEFIDFLVSI
jgi:hypothetical protein